jgi:hypothetical protein
LNELCSFKSKEESHTPWGMALSAPVIKIIDAVLVQNITWISEYSWQQVDGSEQR